MQSRKRIMVGVSGGVDSSVALAEMKAAGHEVFGVFLRTWQPDWSPCTWRDERRDAMRVCAHLGVPFIEVNAEEAYRRGVADYMIAEYKSGRTPNPDVMCNREVKFGHFLKWALEHGADAVATGHYARIVKSKTSGRYELHESVDSAKDQSYFLWMLTESDLKHILFPVGDLRKSATRMIAEKYKLPTATKKDSQGICFLGPIDMKTFLKHEIEAIPGSVQDIHGNSIGTHDGVLMYTLGERHGFSIHVHSTDERPYYVVGKDIKHNILIVDHALVPVEPKTILDLTNVNDINGLFEEGLACEFRYRYHGERVPCTIVSYDADARTASIQIEQPILIPGGQSCVLYKGTHVIGGGIFV